MATTQQKEQATLDALEAEYCPPLDNSLFHAIVSDFDLTREEDLKVLRHTLDEIRVTAAVQEQDAAFDPSGTFTFDESQSAVSSLETGTQTGTSVSNLSRKLQSYNLGSTSSYSGSESGSGTDDFRDEEMEKADFDTKKTALTHMFPLATEFSVTHTLKKCNENYVRAMEELLNHTFFDESNEERILSKGIDGFAESSHLYNSSGGGRKSRKAPMKKNRRMDRINISQEDGGLQSGTNRRSSSAGVASNKWNQGQEDVDFIALRTCIPAKMISSAYYTHNASLPATLIALLETPSALAAAPPSKGSKSETIEQSAQALGNEFPAIPPHLLKPLVRAAYPSAANAHELAKTLLPRERRQSQSPPARHARNRSLRYNPGIIPQYTPLTLPTTEEASYTSISQRSHSPLSRPSSTTVASAASEAQRYSDLASNAYNSASAAHRRGRSDRLFSAAAGYYSQVGREMLQKREEASGSAANALVASQSVPGEIDLHGVNAQDAVRIAKNECQAWWRSSSSGRGVKGVDGRVFRPEKDDMYLKIITGVGRHSVGGVAKLGPAVMKMLVSDGWKFEVGTGCFVVTGRQR